MGEAPGGGRRAGEYLRAVEAFLRVDEEGEGKGSAGLFSSMERGKGNGNGTGWVPQGKASKALEDGIAKRSSEPTLMPRPWDQSEEEAGLEHGSKDVSIAALRESALEKVQKHEARAKLAADATARRPASSAAMVAARAKIAQTKQTRQRARDQVSNLAKTAPKKHVTWNEQSIQTKAQRNAAERRIQAEQRMFAVESPNPGTSVGMESPASGLRQRYYDSVMALPKTTARGDKKGVQDRTDEEAREAKVKADREKTRREAVDTRREETGKAQEERDEKSVEGVDGRVKQQMEESPGFRSQRLREKSWFAQEEKQAQTATRQLKSHDHDDSVKAARSSKATNPSSKSFPKKEKKEKKEKKAEKAQKATAPQKEESTIETGYYSKKPFWTTEKLGAAEVKKSAAAAKAEAAMLKVKRKEDERRAGEREMRKVKVAESRAKQRLEDSLGYYSIKPGSRKRVLGFYED